MLDEGPNCHRELIGQDLRQMDRREGCIRPVLDPTHEQMEGGHGDSTARWNWS